VTDDDLSLLLDGVTLVASAKETPCRLRFDAAFLESHSNLAVMSPPAG
jgi:hypothetical protein